MVDWSLYLYECVSILANARASHWDLVGFPLRLDLGTSCVCQSASPSITGSNVRPENHQSIPLAIEDHRRTSEQKNWKKGLWWGFEPNTSAIKSFTATSSWETLGLWEHRVMDLSYVELFCLFLQAFRGWDGLIDWDCTLCKFFLNIVLFGQVYVKIENDRRMGDTLEIPHSFIGFAWTSFGIHRPGLSRLIQASHRFPSEKNQTMGHQ